MIVGNIPAVRQSQMRNSSPPNADYCGIMATVAVSGMAGCRAGVGLQGKARRPGFFYSGGTGPSSGVSRSASSGFSGKGSTINSISSSSAADLPYFLKLSTRIS